MEAFRLHGPVLNPRTKDHAEWYPDGVIVVGESGIIQFSGNETHLPADLHTLPRRKTHDLILPGFIDLHTHLPQYDCRGKFGKSLLEWLDKFIFPEERRFADVAVARGVASRFFAALTEAGTTTAMVFSSIHRDATHAAFEEAERSRLRVIMGKVQMDRDISAGMFEHTGDSIRDTQQLIEAWHRKTPRLWYAVSPRFAPSCTMELLRASAQLAAQYKTYIQTHLNESAAEIDLVRTLFPGYASYTAVYAAAGLLQPRTILAHNIHCSDDELTVCERSGSAVAHCPDSNLFLGSGRFPMHRYEDTAIRLGLGTDIGAGTSVSMLHTMKMMAAVQARSLHPFIPLYHATLGGAAALALDDYIGSLDSGKQADFITLRIDSHFSGGRDITSLAAMEIASAAVYRSQPSDVTSTWVGGECLYRNGPAMQTLDAE